jgi:hypothetical protein
MSREELLTMSRRGIQTLLKRYGALPLARLSPEERRAAGRKCQRIHGNPFADYTFEQLSSNGLKGALALSKQLTTEQRAEYGRRGADALRKRRYNIRGNCYPSKQEAACALLMEKYLPSFHIIEGITYQVNGDLTHAIDFLVNGVFIEYHPILLFFSMNGNLGDFTSMDDYQAFKHEISILDGERRNACRQRHIEHLSNLYILRRKAIIDASDTYKGSEIVLVRSPSELYDRVICRFGKNIPSKAVFVREFRLLRDTICH